MSSMALEAETMRRFAVGFVWSPGSSSNNSSNSSSNNSNSGSSGSNGSNGSSMSSMSNISSGSSTGPPRVSSLDFDASGAYLAACSGDDTVRLFGVKGGTCLKAVKVARLGCGLVRFTHHPNALLVASGAASAEERVQYLSLHDNSYLRTFKGHTGVVSSLEVSPVDDSFLTGSADRTARRWDLRTPQCVGVIKAQHRATVAFGPQGLIFAVGGGGTVKLYDVRCSDAGPFADFACSKQDAGNTWDSMGFSRDGQTLLLAAASGRVLLLDAFSGKVRREYRQASGEGDAGGPAEACFSPDAQFVLAGSRDGDVSVWDTVSGRPVTSLRGHPAGTAVRCVRWHSSRLLLATGARDLALWIPDIGVEGGGTQAPRRSSLSSRGGARMNTAPAAVSDNDVPPPIPGSTADLTVRVSR
jgi:COMPASS component SWD2